MLCERACQRARTIGCTKLSDLRISAQECSLALGNFAREDPSTRPVNSADHDADLVEGRAVRAKILDSLPTTFDNGIVAIPLTPTILRIALQS